MKTKTILLQDAAKLKKHHQYKYKIKNYHDTAPMHCNAGIQTKLKSSPQQKRKSRKQKKYKCKYKIQNTGQV